MQALKLAVGVAWIVFWIYWLASAATSKASVRGGWRTRLTGVSVVAVIVIADAFRGGGLAMRSVILAVDRSGAVRQRHRDRGLGPRCTSAGTGGCR